MGILFSLLGLVAGMLSGLVGIGGGIVIVPALVYLFGFDQKSAQGTTLALMVPPIGLLAAWEYYRQGHVDVKVALFIILGFVLGGWVGSKVALTLSTLMLKRVFGVTLLLIALRMLFAKG